jgi:homoserine O-acetyltransferase
MLQEDYETFKLGDWELQSGEKIADAHIAYKTFGDPKSPAIVYPSWFSGCMSVTTLMHTGIANTTFG